MMFWLKIGLLAGVTYVACNATFLLQDRRDRHQMVREVEAVTRMSFAEVQAGECSRQTLDRLLAAQNRLASADERWERDASRLLLLNN